MKVADIPRNAKPNYLYVVEIPVSNFDPYEAYVVYAKEPDVILFRGTSPESAQAALAQLINTMSELALGT